MNTFQNITRRAIELTVFWFVIQLAFAGAVFAQCRTEAGEFKVNKEDANAQRNPSAAGLPDGGFVVTWESDRQDGSGYGIYGQLFNRSGDNVGTEFQVNSYVIDEQSNPAAAGLPDRGFVVTWQSNVQDSSSYGVYGQVFDSSGNKVGTEFQVNTCTNKTQANSSVAALLRDGFVVTWQSNVQDSSSYGVYGQVFDSSGNKVGTEFQVNTYTNNSQGRPSAAGLSGGGFVVTWDSEGQDGDRKGIYGQVFDSSGNKVGTEFPVNTYTTGLQYYPSVAALSGGGFVVTWMDSIQENGYHGVYGQVFGSSGNKLGSEFRVNTHSASDQWRPSAAGLSGGGFVVAWESSAQDGSGYGIYGQVFHSSGNKVGSEFRVNTYAANNQLWPSVAGLSGGGFVVAWESYGQDGSGEGVYGQRYSCRNGVAKDELIVDFGEIYGLWHYDQEGLPDWSLLNPVDPDMMTAVDIDGDGRDELAAAFSGEGVFTYDPVNDWQRVNTVDPEKMIAADIDGDGKDELVAGFNGYGLYYYDQPGIWSDAPINTILPEAMLRYSDGVICDFGAAYGLWSYNTSAGWVRLNTEDPGQIVAADTDGDGKDELVVSFVGWGVYLYEPEGGIWQQINTVIPDRILSVDIDGDLNDELVISFPGYGLYVFEPEGLIWQQPPINTVIPENMIRHGNGIACDFGAAHGLWIWTMTGGWLQLNDVDPVHMLSVDIDKDGVEQLVVSFFGYGLYYDDEIIGWQPLKDVVPEEMKSINFRP